MQLSTAFGGGTVVEVGRSVGSRFSNFFMGRWGGTKQLGIKKKDLACSHVNILYEGGGSHRAPGTSDFPEKLEKLPGRTAMRLTTHFEIRWVHVPPLESRSKTKGERTREYFCVLGRSGLGVKEHVRLLSRTFPLFLLFYDTK